jgi:hypothetical protein
MPSYPVEQVQDAHKLTADAEIEFYELTPAGTNAKIRFKPDNTMTWLGNEYTGLPVQFSGESQNAEGTMSQPKLVIGQPDIDLSMFKGLIYDGTIDGARIDKYTVLLTHALANQNIKRTNIYRVKRVDGYSALAISLSLATFSVTGPNQMPFRLYIPPAFPFVRL